MVFEDEEDKDTAFKDLSLHTSASWLRLSKPKLCSELSQRMPRKRSVLPKRDSLMSLKAELETRDHVEFPTSYCIYRVPPIVRKMNQAAYTPITVSIGPYHHGNKRFKSMEEVKLWFLYNFLKRNKEKSFDDYVDVLKDKESKIRSCYSENIPMESDEFVRMILTDACFIIEYFLLYIGVDRSLSKLRSMEIRPDFILLENQLPFFILEDLFDLNFPNGRNDEYSFVAVTFGFFCCAFLSGIVPNKKLSEKFTYTYFKQHHLPRLPDGTPKVHHLCDMLRIFFVRLDQLPRECNGSVMNPVYNASKLHDAGIKFEVNEDEVSILRLQFSKGVLKIPRTRVSDFTDIEFRNVVAFEGCHFHWSRSMTDYIVLLDLLIRTGKDVEMLEEKGIIENYIGENDAVATITKRLSRNTTIVNFNNGYISLFEELNKFCDSPYYKYRAIFKQQYWSTPWRIASFLGAILLLFLTLIQTISSVIALFQN